MKTFLSTVAATSLLLLLAIGSARAGDVNLNVHLGAPPVPIIVPEPPLFLVPPHLGFRVAIDLPYDMVQIDGRYFLFRDNGWYVAPHYNGPWRGIAHKNLPPGLRKHKLSTIRDHRDEEHRKYKKEKHSYKGKKYRPDGKDEKGGHGKGKKNKHDD